MVKKAIKVVCFTSEYAQVSALSVPSLRKMIRRGRNSPDSDGFRCSVIPQQASSLPCVTFTSCKLGLPRGFRPSYMYFMSGNAMLASGRFPYHSSEWQKEDQLVFLETCFCFVFPVLFSGRESYGVLLPLLANPKPALCRQCLLTGGCQSGETCGPQLTAGVISVAHLSVGR